MPKEEKRKGYHLSERHYGSFQRAFSLPKGVDADKIEASFSKGVLSISLPKKPEAMNADKKVYFENFLAPTTQKITATVTPSMPRLTCSCSNVAASARPKNGCSS